MGAAACTRYDTSAHRASAQVLDLADQLRGSYEVVLAGDWNVSRAAIDVTPRLRTEEPHATARAQLNDRLARDGWLDVFRALHPEQRGHTWYRRGAKLDAARLDYIVACSAPAQ